MFLVCREVTKNNSFVCLVRNVNVPGTKVWRPDIPDHVPFEVVNSDLDGDYIEIRVWVFPEQED